MRNETHKEVSRLDLLLVRVRSKEEGIGPSILYGRKSHATFESLYITWCV